MEYFSDEHERRPRVLFVDSGHARRCAAISESSGQFTVVLAGDGRAALDFLRNDEIAIIVIDEAMPDMAAPYLLAAVQELSPATAAIVLTSSATNDAPQAGHNIRTLLTSCSEHDLRAQIDILLDERRIRHEREVVIDPTEALADALLSEEPIADTLRRAAQLHPDFARTMTEQELAATDVLDSDGSDGTASVIGLQRPTEAAAGPIDGVIVFSADPHVIRCVADAAQERFPLFVASNIVQVVKLLRTHALGVLITDIAEDRNTIAAMTGRLKYHVPALVTVAISAQRDPAEMAWLINHGHIFRFLRKPLSIGRCAVCLHAALQHHETLRATTGPVVAADDGRSDDSGVISGVFEKLRAVTGRLG